MTIKTNSEVGARMVSPRACLAFSALDTVLETCAFVGRMREALKGWFQASSTLRTVRQGTSHLSQPDEDPPIFRGQRHRLPPRHRNPAALLP